MTWSQADVICADCALVDPDPAKLKRDLVKLLGASAGWDKPGR